MNDLGGGVSAVRVHGQWDRGAKRARAHERTKGDSTLVRPASVNTKTIGKTSDPRRTFRALLRACGPPHTSPHVPGEVGSSAAYSQIASASCTLRLPSISTRDPRASQARAD